MNNPLGKEELSKKLRKQDDLSGKDEDQLIMIVRLLVSALDAKSEWTRGHSERVATYSQEIAIELGLGEKVIKRLMLAALLHDIGKIGTSDILLEKRESLTSREYEVIKMHPIRSANILVEIKQFKDIILIVRHHHEHIDGSGYPDGIKGEDIPLGSRILHVVDSFDAMTDNRPYRQAINVDSALSEIKSRAGTQYDSKVVEAFVNVVSSLREI
jgi:putative nucleotidyltransferase with HDIG domain